jgi:hypothetical protein
MESQKKQQKEQQNSLDMDTEGGEGAWNIKRNKTINANWNSTRKKDVDTIKKNGLSFTVIALLTPLSARAFL